MVISLKTFKLITGECAICSPYGEPQMMHKMTIPSQVVLCLKVFERNGHYYANRNCRYKLGR